MNRTIKEATVQRFHYQTTVELNSRWNYTLEKLGSQVLNGIVAEADFELLPLVQGHITIPDPARDPAAVVLADTPAQRVVGEDHGVAIRPCYTG
jgi:hypothetical protein